MEGMFIDIYYDAQGALLRRRFNAQTKQFSWRLGELENEKDIKERLGATDLTALRIVCKYSFYRCKEGDEVRWYPHYFWVPKDAKVSKVYTCLHFEEALANGLQTHTTPVHQELTPVPYQYHTDSEEEK